LAAKIDSSDKVLIRIVYIIEPSHFETIFF